MKRACILVFIATAAAAQAPGMKELMLDLIHPAFNEILLLVNRGGPKDEAEWASARRSALILQESAVLLRDPGLSRPDAGWPKVTKVFADAGTGAYRAAKAKDDGALAAATESLEASCTMCHKQYRPNVFPPRGEAK